MARHKTLAALRPLGFIATFSSGLQGLVWAGFYLAALLTHYCILSSDDATSPLTFSNYLAAYLQGSSCSSKSGSNVFCVDLVGPGQLAVWFLLTVFFNLLQFTASVTLYAVLVKCTKDRWFVFINTWICVCVITLLLDVVLSVIFAIDLVALENATCMNDRGLSGLVLAALLTFSLRGILLLVANLGFIIYFIVTSYKLREKIQKNKDLDLTSNWPSTSDSSYDFGSVPPERDDVFGIVNPLHDSTRSQYPEYTAKSRWPTLNPSFNTVPNQRTYIEEPNEPLKRNQSIKSGYQQTNDNTKRFSSPNNQDNNNYDRQGVFHLELSSPTQHNQLQTRTEPRTATFHDQIFGDAFNAEYNRNKNIIESRNNYNNNNSSTNNNYGHRFESKTMPTHRSMPVPVPPPMPPQSRENSSKTFQPTPLRRQSQISPQQIEPDYSPNPVRRQILPQPVSNRQPNFMDDKAALRMTLHEQIKSRPPLRPVLQRMTVSSTGF